MVVVAVLAQLVVAPEGGGNALTLPAARHIVRMVTPSGPVWLAALQQDNAGGHGLGFFRSNDDGQSYFYYQPIQNDYTERDTADLLPVGLDVAVVYSYEGPNLTGSTRHNVYFQWWRHAGSDWTPEASVEVFASPSSSAAYYRGELAIDSMNRIWVTADFLNPDGSATLCISVSTDGGNTFQRQPDLDTVPHRAGGRLLALGEQLILVYGMHNGPLSRFILRNDSEPVSTWGPTQTAFPDGIYHGAALSAVADGEGGMHFVYKSEGDENLYYRYFNGASFGPATLLDGSSDWALQPATTLIGSDLAIFYNHMLLDTNGGLTTSYEMDLRWMHDGVLTPPTKLTGAGDFKGYPSAVEDLPPRFPMVSCMYGETPNADVSGNDMLVVVPYPYLADAGTPPVDAGKPPADGGVPPVDAGRPPADGGLPPVDAGTALDGGVLFSDNFTNTTVPDKGLGTSWTLVSGLWYERNGTARTDQEPADQAQENIASCLNCSVQAVVISFGVPEIGVFVRSPQAAPTTHYLLVLLSNGHVQIRRVLNGVVTSLADTASGLASLNSPALLRLSVSGTSPVRLTGFVNGKEMLTVTDGAATALKAPGYAGLWTTHSGVSFGNFQLTTP
jgi:hypothetical protein